MREDYRDFYVAMIIFTIMILVADFVMNKYFVNRFGGSKIGNTQRS